MFFFNIPEAEDVVEVQEEFAENQEMEAEREPTTYEIMLCITQLCNWGKGKTKVTPEEYYFLENMLDRLSDCKVNGA